MYLKHFYWYKNLNNFRVWVNQAEDHKMDLRYHTEATFKKQKQNKAKTCTNLWFLLNQCIRPIVTFCEKTLICWLHCRLCITHHAKQLTWYISDLGKKRHQDFLADQVNPLIPLELFQRHVIPVVGKVFPSRELHVRSILLRQFTHYADLFNEEKLKKVILPQVGGIIFFHR